MAEWVSIVSVGISAVALVASGAAAAFTWVSAKQAKRQADAVLGEVPASFGVYQNPPDELTSLAHVTFEIVNHNRRALLVSTIELRSDDRVDVFRDHIEERDMYMDLIRRVSSNSAKYSFAIPLRIRGCGNSSPPEFFTIPILCRWRDFEDTEPTRLSVKCCYQFDGDDDWSTGYASAVIVRPEAS